MKPNTNSTKGKSGHTAETLERVSSCSGSKVLKWTVTSQVSCVNYREVRTR